MESKTRLTKKQWAYFGIFFFVVLCIAFIYINVSFQNVLKNQKQEAASQADRIVYEIETEINNIVSTTSMIENLYIVYGDAFLNDFYKICDEFSRSDVVIGSMYFAPEGKIQYAYPHKVDKATAGFEMLYDKIQGPKAMLAKTSGLPTIAGPHDLIEGGQGFIVRNPIYDEDGNFLAFTIVVIDKDLLMSEIQNNISEKSKQYHFAVWKDEDPTAVVNEHGYILATTTDVIESDVVKKFNVANDNWYLTLEPIEGWYALEDINKTIMFTGFSVALLMLFVYFYQINMNRQSQLKQLAIEAIETDELTGVYTKQAFYHYVREHLNLDEKGSYDILITDFKNFKLINTNFGETVGDKILVTFASYLKSHFENCIIARYSGDQFVVFNATPSDSMKEENIKRFIQKYKDMAPIKDLVLNLGIYEQVDRRLSVSMMCSRALLALTSIKQNYTKDYEFYDGEVSQQELRAREYETRFETALENNEFQVWLQPKYNIYTDGVVGAEALIRWKIDNHYVSPGEFIPVFEDDGLIRRLDEFVFRTVCAYQAKNRDNNLPLVPISVNISRISFFQDSVLDLYKSIIEEYGVNKRYVPIEITESAAVGSSKIFDYVDAFYNAGFSLHMDDFGSGSSSLSSLNTLHFDVVKLDKSLIDMIGDYNGELTLMYSMALGREMSLQLVAEGVENEQQVEFLKDNGCEVVQGFYYAKPMPIDEYERKVLGYFDPNIINFQAAYYKNNHFGKFFRYTMDKMLSGLPGGFLIYEADQDAKILMSNSYIWHLYDCQSEDEFLEFVGGSFKGMVNKDEWDRVQDTILTQIKTDTNESDYVKYHITTKTGAIKFVLDFGHLEHVDDLDLFYVFINEDKFENDD